MSLEDILTSVEQDATLAAQADAPAAEAQTAQTAVGGEGLGGLGALFSNPEMIAKVPLLLQAVRSLTEPLPGGRDCVRPATPVALLGALRPYLNERRRSALDTMIRVSRLGETIRTLNGKGGL